MDAINLAEKLGLFTACWDPKVIGDVNGTAIKLVKLEGEFVRHRHEREDELFLVLSGRLVMRYRDREVTVRPGELVIVPHGVEHQPVADAGTAVLLVEPSTTLNTGDVRDERTVDRPERL